MNQYLCSRDGYFPNSGSCPIDGLVKASLGIVSSIIREIEQELLDSLMSCEGNTCS